jgi:hypothetical protein
VAFDDDGWITSDERLVRGSPRPSAISVGPTKNQPPCVRNVTELKLERSSFAV